MSARRPRSLACLMSGPPVVVQRLTRPPDSAKYPHVSATTAEIRLHMRTDFRVGRRRIVIEQGLRAHDHAGDAIPALGRLLSDKGLLQDSGFLFGAQPLHRDDTSTLQGADWGDARVNGHAVEHDRAGTALTQSAAEFRAIHRERTAQH